MIVNLGNAAAYAAAAGWLLFALLYGTMAPWWRSPIGRSVFGLAVVLATVFGLVTVQLVFGVAWVGREWVRLAVFAGVAVAAWTQLYALLVRQLSRPPAPGEQGE